MEDLNKYGQNKGQAPRIAVSSLQNGLADSFFFGKLFRETFS